MSQFSRFSWVKTSFDILRCMNCFTFCNPARFYHLESLLVCIKINHWKFLLFCSFFPAGFLTRKVYQEGLASEMEADLATARHSMPPKKLLCCKKNGSNSKKKTKLILRPVNFERSGVSVPFKTLKQLFPQNYTR